MRAKVPSKVAHAWDDAKSCRRAAVNVSKLFYGANGPWAPYAFAGPFEYTERPHRFPLHAILGRPHSAILDAANALIALLDTRATELECTPCGGER